MVALPISRKQFPEDQHLVNSEIFVQTVVRLAVISVRNHLLYLQPMQQVILTLRTFSIVTEIIYDKDTKKAKGVRVLDARTNEALEFISKIVFLCASTFNSAWILMNSATDIWPDGLGSSSGEFGHNVMDHHLKLGASGEMEGFEDKYYSGFRPNGIYIPRFRNLPGDEKRNYLRGFGYQGAASRESWPRQVAELNIGAEFKECIGEPGKWTMGIGGFGEMLPYHENKITLSKDKKDKWNMPNILQLMLNSRKMKRTCEKICWMMLLKCLKLPV